MLAFIVDIPSDGWTEVRQIETMHGGTGHSEIRIDDHGSPVSPEVWRLYRRLLEPLVTLRPKGGLRMRLVRRGEGIG